MPELVYAREIRVGDGVAMFKDGRLTREPIVGIARDGHWLQFSGADGASREMRPGSRIVRLWLEVDHGPGEAGESILAARTHPLIGQPARVAAEPLAA